ncbi:hypothetical protein T484DRAFT_1976050 [Baffinella frigidus]|nr:hypothetical protein T484DRAFT_1976050 [Cryptophyta sp. CCMP2293]
MAWDSAYSPPGVECGELPGKGDSEKPQPCLPVGSTTGERGALRHLLMSSYQESMDIPTRGESYVSLAETVRQDDAADLCWDTVDLGEMPSVEESDRRWSLVDSAPNSPNAPPTRPSISAPGDGHVSFENAPGWLVAITELPVEAVHAPAEMEALQSLKDKLQAVRDARHALVAAPPRRTRTAAQTSPTPRHSAPRGPSAEIGEGPVEQRWRSESSPPAWWQRAPVQRAPAPRDNDTPENARAKSCMAVATPARAAPAFKAALTPLPPEMQAPCLFCPPVLSPTPANLYGRQAGRHGWSEAPVRSSVRGMDDDSSYPRVVRDRRALAPRLTELDARHQCPALFITHDV